MIKILMGGGGEGEGCRDGGRGGDNSERCLKWGGGGGKSLRNLSKKHLKIKGG